MYKSTSGHKILMSGLEMYAKGARMYEDELLKKFTTSGKRLKSIYFSPKKAKIFFVNRCGETKHKSIPLTKYLDFLVLKSSHGEVKSVKEVEEQLLKEKNSVHDMIGKLIKEINNII